MRMLSHKLLVSAGVILIISCCFISCRPRVGYNKYLYMRTTPSEQIAKDHVRANKKAERAYRREQKKLRRQGKI
jgi:hypothetical protein